MSKAIWICSRKEFLNTVEQKINQICESILPDNIVPADPQIIIGNNVAYGVVNPKKSILYNGYSLLLGVISGNHDDWHVPLQDFPDGSYALFRNTKQSCEIVSDPVGSRSIWYYKNDDIFVAATSQVALIKFIGDFEFDERVVPWMLSTGSLGPTHSWDKRITRVPPNSSVVLNKNSWSLTTKKNKIEFKVSKDSDKSHEQKLRIALDSSIESMRLNYADWVLPVSGGYDSRGILCLLKAKSSNKDLNTITWGLKSSLNDSKNDAFVAQELAKELKVSHQYYHTDLSEEPIEKIIDRFLKNGEGRIDHISGYLDGFKIWQILHDENIQGIIRGDEGFGWSKVYSAPSTRLKVGLGLCSDYHNLKSLDKMGVFEQEIPKDLEQSTNESMEQWRDRLYHEYRLPVILAALSDLKLSYVEQVNPLLFRKVLEQVRKQPDYLRTEKSLFKKIVISLSPKVPFATNSANASMFDFFKQKQVVDLLKEEITSNLENEIMPKKFLIDVLENIKISNNGLDKTNSISIKNFIKLMLPVYLKTLLKKQVSSLTVLDYNQLAFRVFIILRMVKTLKSK